MDRNLARQGGLEPPTSRSRAARSTHLSYRRTTGLRRRRSWGDRLKIGAAGPDRTADAQVFNLALYLLSYRGKR